MCYYYSVEIIKKFLNTFLREVFQRTSLLFLVMSYYRENRREQKAFYRSHKWQDTRNAYFKKARGLCEICLAKGLIKQGEIVHHKVEMNSETIQNEALAYGFDNLQLVCRDCHANIHDMKKKYAGRSKRYKVNEFGEVLT